MKGLKNEVYLFYRYFGNASWVSVCIKFTGLQYSRINKKHSSINQDEYRNVREIAGPKQYFDTASNSGSFFFLTHHDGDIKKGTKLIIQVTQSQWSFYEEAYWAPGVPAKLTKVNDDVAAGSLGGAYIQEVVALEMPERVCLRNMPNQAKT